MRSRELQEVDELTFDCNLVPRHCCHCGCSLLKNYLCPKQTDSQDPDLPFCESYLSFFFGHCIETFRGFIQVFELPVAMMKNIQGFGFAIYGESKMDRRKLPKCSSLLREECDFNEFTPDNQIPTLLF